MLLGWRAAAAGGACAALLLTGSPARAESWYWQLALGPSTEWLPQSPRFSMDEQHTPLRTVAGGDAGTIGETSWLGGYADLGFAISDRWQIPVVGVGVYVPLGSYATTRTVRDGSFLELQPWTAFLVDVPLPGIGMRVKQRRWMFTGSIRTAVVIASVEARVASGADWTSVGRVSATLFALRAEITACRRLDPESRACLWLSPNLYEVGLANGGSLGLRWEWGP
ncbi:MAG: hypothetical protein JOZ69_06660 [Myxococcales bacterium]|nr:hypothetical protein [Myxococcales bacterium]